MFRLLALAVVVLFAAGTSSAADKPQMVKGTLKSADPTKDLLVINQKLKNENVERQLSITKTTEFTITIDGKTEKTLGREGLSMISGKEGTVNVKCDKDVNVLSVTVMIKK